MISVKKNFDAPPDKLIKKGLIQIKDALINKNKHDFKDSVYRDTTIEVLKLLYKNKCAYCESDGSASAPFQVEHFRPKAKITGDTNHKGYYWLAYEWSNLILSCSSCNNAKGNHFPVKGVRVFDPILEDITNLPLNIYSRVDSDIFKNEEAILLNPEIDDVESCFYFLPNGEIVGINEQGKGTIDKLNLNRLPLKTWRKKIVDVYLNEMQEILDDLDYQKITPKECRYAIKRVFNRIEVHQSSEKPYSRFGFFMFNKFEIFFANQLDMKQRDAILKFFDLYKRGEL